MYKHYEALKNWDNGLWGDNYFVHKVSETDKEINIFLKAIPHEAVCPDCGKTSSKLACGTSRTLRDLPFKGLLATTLHVQTYRYVCTNPECPGKVFSDPLPFAHFGEYRTDRLNTLILGMSIFMSNEGTSRVLGHMGITVSTDAIRRLWQKVQFEDLPDIEEIGIDDIALRKGQSYATSLYSADHRLIAILEGRTADDVKQWLAQHPKIKRVARDRASAYASALAEVLPDAMQVADRFHLLQNLLKQLNDILQNDLPPEFWIGTDGLMEKSEVNWAPAEQNTQPLVDTSMLHYDNTPLLDAAGNPVPFDAKNHLTGSAAAKERLAKRQQKQERIRAVQELHEKERLSLAEIARRMNLAPSTVGRYVHMTQEDIAALESPKPQKRKSRAGRYRNIVHKMMVDGHDDRTIFWYLRRVGIDDPAASICTTIRTISVNNFPDRKLMHTDRITGTSSARVPVNAQRFSRKQVGIYLCSLEENCQPNPLLEAHLPELCAAYPTLSWAQSAFEIFYSVITGDDADAVDRFIAAYQTSPLKSFCHGLSMDIEAVKNAVCEDLSSGFVEGGNNKIKVIKRIGYGRASLKTLEKKSVAAFVIT
ncbi:MAG: ISL3 family transposase, partial [Clostridia bacterium]|nr:ISL3 family transposase [Clostridia bacterium]